MSRLWLQWHDIGQEGEDYVWQNHDAHPPNLLPVLHSDLHKGAESGGAHLSSLQARHSEGLIVHFTAHNLAMLG